MKSRDRVHDKHFKCKMIVRKYARDVRISFKDLYLGRTRGNSGGKRAITKFSKRSARELRFELRNSSALWKAMITLTYPSDFPCDGAIVKGHVNAWCQFLRRRDIKYFWILEFQERGAPHFHFLTSEEIDKGTVSQRWYEIVGSGDEKHLRAGTRCDTVRNENQLFGYMVGYLKKLTQKVAPKDFENVGRWWGCSRDIMDFTCRVFSGDFRSMTAEMRDYRRWYKHHLKGFGINWKWKGAGFTALDGSAPLATLYASNHIFKDTPKVGYKQIDGQIKKVVWTKGKPGFKVL